MHCSIEKERSFAEASRENARTRSLSRSEGGLHGRGKCTPLSLPGRSNMTERRAAPGAAAQPGRRIPLLHALVILAILSSALSLSRTAAGAPLAQGAENAWSDPFADGSGIDSSAGTALQTSEFGGDFVRYAGNPLTSLADCDPWDGTAIPGSIHPSVLYFPEGMDGYSLWMVFTPYTVGGAYEWERPTLVRSNDGINWEKTDDYTNPLISPGPSGTWDEDFLADPDVVYTTDMGWFLYYAGASPQYIGVATSSDGKHWTKHSGNPIVNQAVPGGAVVSTRTPSVLYDEEAGTFHMWYNIELNNIGYATSTDGLNWTPYAGNPVLSPTSGSWDSASISHQDVITYAGAYWMYYIGSVVDYRTSLSIGLATSSDGINWTQYAGNPVLTMGTDEWESGTLYHPGQVVVDDEMWLYYSGVNTANVSAGTVHEIGLATSADDGHVLLEQEFQPAEYAPRSGDTVAWYHLNEGASPGPSQYESTSDTLAWYHLDEESGSTAADASDNANTGTLVGGTTWTSTGIIANALQFDGTSGYVQIPNQPALNPVDEVTIEAWVNPDVLRGNNYIVSKYGGSENCSYGLKVGYQTDGKIGGWICHNGTLYQTISTAAVPAGQWSHVAMTYSSSDPDHAPRLYLNGEEVASYDRRDTIPSDYTIDTSTSDVLLGALPYSPSYLYLDGRLDEVRVLGRALTAGELAADAQYAPDVLDASGNAHDGWTQGGTTWVSGRFSHGLEFDGTTGYGFVPYSPTLNISDELTIEAWIHPDLVRDNNYILSRSSQTDASYGFKVGFQQDNKLHGWVMHDGVLYESIASLGVPANEWSFVAMTYDSTEGRIALYYNGEEVTYDQQDAVPGDGTIDATTSDLLLGKLAWTPTTERFLDGRLDEIRILSRALSAGDVVVDYGQSYTPTGELTSVLLTPPEDQVWDRFSASDTRPTGTGITYTILGENYEVLLTDVVSGTDISSLNSTPIRLHADLSTTAPAETPLLDEWGVSWQAGPTTVGVSSLEATGPSRITVFYAALAPLTLAAAALVALTIARRRG
jgi:hypothetical protein